MDSTALPNETEAGLRQQITELQQELARLAQEAAAGRLAEKRVQQLLDSIQDPVFALDAALCFTYWNRQSEINTGLPAAQVAGRPLFQVFPELQGSELEAAYRQALASGRPRYLEYRWEYQGRVTFHDVNVYPMDGGLAVFSKDITPRRQTETLNAALNTINQLIHSTLDVETVLDAVLAAAAQAIGCHSAAISLRQGDRWRVRSVYGFGQENVGLELDDDQERHAVLCIQTRQPVAVNDAFTDPRVNTAHMRKWNVRAVLVIPIVLRGRAIGVIFLNYHGEPFSFAPHHIHFATQLAASLSLALENARLFQDLQREAEELLQAEQAIQDYSHQLELSNRELESFAFAASHDLQEPLRKVEMFGSLLADQAGPAFSAEQQDYLRRMRDAAGRLQKMLSDLLELSRVTTRGQPFAPIDLNAVVKNVVGDLEPMLHKTGGRVVLGDLPAVQADPAQMHQLFLNLIGNGLKFHRPDWPPVVKISAMRPPGGQVEITVADNGIGFDMAYAEKIFLPFQRLHGRSEYEGTGMGLSICRRIVERHGGSLTVASTPGQGTVFTVLLPAAGDTPD